MTRHPLAWAVGLIFVALALALLGLHEGPTLGKEGKPGQADIPGTELPAAEAKEVGLATDRLPRIDEAVRRAIEDGQVPGAVYLVARRGRVVRFEAQGVMDLASKKPMRKDTLFRMASSTKPVTAVAVLMLMEEGKLRLTDPVSRFIPELKHLKVAVSRSGGQEPDLVPAEREVTIRDLLTHTSGLGSGGPGAKALARLMQERKPADTLADFIPRLGSVPLDFQPGSRWRYSGLAGFDTLARVVEVASGKPFDRFLRERVFEPLGMRDTFFVVPEDRRDRLAPIYRKTEKGLERMEVPSVLASEHYFSGAGGLSSTAEDYGRFAQMLLNGGRLNGHRLLGPRTVDLMASNHVGSMFAGQLGRPPGVGFGLGVEVVQDAVQAGWRRSNGSYGWDGAFGTTFWVDPREQMIVVLLLQRGGTRDVHHDFENAVMQAIVE